MKKKGGVLQFDYAILCNQYTILQILANSALGATLSAVNLHPPHLKYRICLL